MLLGDIAFRVLNYAKKRKIKNCHVTVCDINQPMLEAGKARMKGVPDYEAMEWVKDDAENSAFPDNCFTAYTIAFGIRNCTHYDKVLEEAHRILQPGGKFLCLEAFRAEGTIFIW